jgi:hypothetical protein
VAISTHPDVFTTCPPLLPLAAGFWGHPVAFTASLWFLPPARDFYGDPVAFLANFWISWPADHFCGLPTGFTASQRAFWLPSHFWGLQDRERRRRATFPAQRWRVPARAERLPKRARCLLQNKRQCVERLESKAADGCLCTCVHGTSRRGAPTNGVGVGIILADQPGAPAASPGLVQDHDAPVFAGWRARERIHGRSLHKTRPGRLERLTGSSRRDRDICRSS